MHIFGKTYSHFRQLSYEIGNGPSTCIFVAEACVICITISQRGHSDGNAYVGDANPNAAIQMAMSGVDIAPLTTCEK